MRNPFNIIKHLPHFLRKKFKEKYIIIESDDWGLERGLTKESINWMKAKYSSEKLSRWSFDSLETEEDLNQLYEVLESYKNKFEEGPVITANFITHNIDYSSRSELKFKPISEGFNYSDSNLKDKYSEGIRNKYIYPQLHGFSHYNISESEKYFQTEEGQESLRQNFFYSKSTVKGNLKFLQGELGIKNSDNNRIKKASEEFKKYFGFYSSSVIPPTYIFDINYLKDLKESNIKLIQSSNRLVSSDGKRYRFPYFQKRKGVFWSVRNARLDPHISYGFNHEQCIESIGRAFKSSIPAVIDFHRVNFAGRFAPDYRASTIKELGYLFEKIYQKWPETKFIHSQKLNNILWQQETR